jgi:N-acetylglucosamine kinase-like BadF-type ATPase
VARKLDLTANKVPLAVTGGVVLAHESYRKRIVEALHTFNVAAEPVTPVTEPAEGAIRLALKSCRSERV